MTDFLAFGDDLVQLLGAAATVGQAEQAFPFLTATEDNYPHVCLLSRAELRITRDKAAMCAVVASQRSRANLTANDHAGLIAIAGDTAHYLKLSVAYVIENSARYGGVFRLVEHKRDSIGIEMSPIRFMASEELSRLENWSDSAALLGELEHAWHAAQVEGPSYQG